MNTEEFPLVKSMLLHDPKARPEASEVLDMDFMQSVREEEEMAGEGGDVLGGRRFGGGGNRVRRNTSGSSD